jgi:hypothetical protein
MAVSDVVNLKSYEFKFGFNENMVCMNFDGVVNEIDGMLIIQNYRNSVEFLYWPFFY